MDSLQYGLIAIKIVPEYHELYCDHHLKKLIKITCISIDSTKRTTSGKVMSVQKERKDKMKGIKKSVNKLNQINKFH